MVTAHMLQELQQDLPWVLHRLQISYPFEYLTAMAQELSRELLPVLNGLLEITPQHQQS
jgi:hypothetical protein